MRSLYLQHWKACFLKSWHSTGCSNGAFSTLVCQNLKVSSLTKQDKVSHYLLLYFCLFNSSYYTVNDVDIYISKHCCDMGSSWSTGIVAVRMMELWAIAEFLILVACYSNNYFFFLSYSVQLKRNTVHLNVQKEPVCAGLLLSEVVAHHC